MSDDGRALVKFGLKVADREMEASARVPTGPIKVVDLLPVLHGISNAIISVAEEQISESGKSISCRAGCGACCRQIVPISEPDARHLAALVASMPEERRRHVVARFQAALDAFEAKGLLGKMRTISQFPPDERLKIAIDYFRAGIPCPFLEEESCSIHPYRPMSCREYLVTSPAENCRDPRADVIEMVPLPAKPSLVLYRFGDGKGEDKWRYLPLVLALEWAAEHADDPQTELPGPELLMNFIRRIARAPAEEPPHPALP